MKKTCSLLMILLLCMALIAGCGAGEDMAKQNAPTDTTIPPSAQDTAESAPEDLEQLPSGSPVSPMTDNTSVSPDKHLEIGSTVRYGNYDWIVLDESDGKSLLLTKHCIAIKYGNISDIATDALQTLVEDSKMQYWGLSDFEGFKVTDKKYDGIYEDYKAYIEDTPGTFSDEMWYTSWEKCTLRQWLNNEMEFTPEEWEGIIATEVIDATGLGANTYDKVFLLDDTAVKKYFPRNESRGASLEAVSDEELLQFLKESSLIGTLSGTIAEKALNARYGSDFYWWVLGSSEQDYFIKPMSTDDNLESMARALNKSLGVRPAIWVETGSIEE